MIKELQKSYKDRQIAYRKSASLWETESTSHRARCAYADGHYQGWHDARSHFEKKWMGLTKDEAMHLAYQAGFNIEIDHDSEEESDDLHWWDGNGEESDDVLFKLQNLIEAKLKEKNT